MTIETMFSNDNSEALGKVYSVDTGTVIVRVTDIERLRRMQVNRLVYLHSSRPGEHLIGIIQKIVRSTRVAQQAFGRHGSGSSDYDEEETEEENSVRIALIGTYFARQGLQDHYFSRSLETVPEIDANCFAIEGIDLTGFMQVVANVGSEGQRLELGSYTLDSNAAAYLNGDKFFQRHALIVGSTGSGKSWTVARVIEQMAALDGANALVFDIHGEYGSLESSGLVRRFRVAGPSDLGSPAGQDLGVIFLPYWLLDYESMAAFFVDRADQNAPNQRSLMSRLILEEKLSYLESNELDSALSNFTGDSPIPFDLDRVIERLKLLDTEMVQGSRGSRQGPHYGRLTRLIERVQNRRTDRRLGFMFESGSAASEYSWLHELAVRLLGGSHEQLDDTGGVKIVDFSEVPSDVLPLMVGLVGRLAFSVQNWMRGRNRHPLAIFCDEAHLYIPSNRQRSAVESVSNDTFERIAKEGRKYGIGLVIISQRPSEVNHTILSQCNNFVSMRLTNSEDQGVVRRLLPDSLGAFADSLPVLDVGEALVVGDASLLPTRIRVGEPECKPLSATIDFWSEWTTPIKSGGIPSAVEGWRKQTQLG